MFVGRQPKAGKLESWILDDVHRAWT